MPTSKKVYSILYSLLFLHEDLYLIPTILRIIRYFFTRSRTAILYILLHSPFHFFHLIFVTLITDNVFFFRRIFHDIKQLHRRELRHIRRLDRKSHPNLRRTPISVGKYAKTNTPLPLRAPGLYVQKHLSYSISATYCNCQQLLLSPNCG